MTRRFRLGFFLSMAAAAGLHVRPCWTCWDLGPADLEAPGSVDRAEAIAETVVCPVAGSRVDAGAGSLVGSIGSDGVLTSLRRAPIAQLVASR